MFERLAAMKERFLHITEEMGKAEVIANMEEWQKLVKEHAALQEVMECYEKYLKASKVHDESVELMSDSDEDMRKLAKAEFEESKEQMAALTEELKHMLLPKDPNDDRNVVFEIRAGAGGDEAGLFGAELCRMYHRYAERKRWTVEEISSNTTELGGVKEVVFMISGKGAYSKLKYESGVHRVQRIPATESQGRVHTSTITVAVLPEVEDIEIEINDKDLRIDTYRSGGAGGQHVNKTDSAVRMTHLPTGLVVICEDERSQIKNREKAMKVLKSRLFDFFQQQADKKYADNRKAQVGTGDRSERIRTYNYPQGRVSDHRIGLTLYSLDTFLDGDIEEMITALQIANQNAQLSEYKE